MPAKTGRSQHELNRFVLGMVQASYVRLTLATVIAFALGMTLMGVYQGATNVYARTDSYRIWLTLVSLLVASMPYCLVIGMRGLRQYSEADSGRDRGLFLAALLCVFILLYLLPLFARQSSWIALPLPYFEVRLTILYLLRATSIGPAFITLWRIRRLAARSATTKPTDDERAPIGPRISETGAASSVPHLVKWRRDADSQLSAVGVVVLLATFTTIGFRNTLIAGEPSLVEDFPSAYVVLYGAALTGILAVNYVPVRATLGQLADIVVESLFPIPDDISRRDSQWQNVLASRECLEQLLGSRNRLRTTLQSAAVVAGPLATTAVSALFTIN